MKKHVLLIFTIFCVTICLAQQKSSIDFIIKNLGLNVDGHFNSFSVSTKFDKANNLKSLSGKIRVESIETGINSRDEHVLEEDYFHVSKYPVITIQAIEIKRESTNTYSATVNLEIKAETKKIEIPITVEALKDSRKITSEFEINRRDFGVGGRSLVMSNRVKIRAVYIEEIK